MNKINQKFGFLVILVILCKKMVKYENLLFFHLKKLESPSPKDALCPIGWNLLSGSEEDEFFNVFNVFYLFCNFLSLENGGTFTRGYIMTSLVRIGPVVLGKKIFKISSLYALCQVLLKLDQWFWRRYFNLVNVFSLFRNYLPSDKCGAFHLNKFESP